MKHSIRIILLIISIISLNCTGWNVFRWGLGSSSHTSPTPEYVKPNSILKGGLVLHSNAIPGGIGKRTEGQLYKGKACSWSAMWLLAGGDSSLDKAKKNARIDFIHSVEYKHEATLGFFHHNFCTIVVGTREAGESEE
jgi:hypothetical protein